MRKLMTILICLLLIGSQVYADQRLYGIDETASTLITYHVDSSFCILIPESLEVGSYPYYFSADELDLCEDNRIVISVSGVNENGYLTLHTNGGKQMIAEVIRTRGNTPVTNGQDIAVFTPTIDYSEDGIYINPIQHEGAGDYYGYLTFNIKVVDPLYVYSQYRRKMTNEEYQKLARRTQKKEWQNEKAEAVRHDMMRHAVFGLCSEAGEVAGVLQKTYQGHEFDREHFLKEISDILWFVSEACDCVDATISDVMEININKLRARYPDGFDSEKSLHRAEGDI